MNTTLHTTRLSEQISRTLLVVFVLGALAASGARSQPTERRRVSDFTTEGREFWLVFQKNFRDWVPDDKTQALRPADPLQLELFITSSRNARGHIEIRGLRFYKEFTVTAGQVINIPIDTAAQVRGSEKIEDLGIHVVADEPIAVYGLNRRFQTTDTYLAHPVNVLGKSYRVVGYRWLQSDLLSQFAIVATEDGTEVTINPTAGTQGPDKGTLKHPAKRPYTIELDRGDVYQVIAKFDPKTMSDLTGSLIESNKPIAVFSGHNCAYVPDPKVKACNLLVEQLPSIRAWGRQFFVGALAGRSSSVLRVVASVDNTQVFENNQLVATLNAGDFYDNPNQTQHTMVTSSQPVMVAQYSKGFDNGDNVGDPMMIVVAPTEQFLSGYRFATPVRGSWRHYINLIVPTHSIDSLRLDGGRVDRTFFKPFGISLYSIAQVEVVYGTHVITSSEPFGLYSYGFGYDEAAYDAYGNGGGQSLEQVIQYDDTLAPTMSATFVRTPGDARGLVTAIARDDRINDKGLEQIILLDNENFDVEIPEFMSGTPQVPIALKPSASRMNGFAQFRLRDRADNLSYMTICAHYNEMGDTLEVTAHPGLDPCDFSTGRQWGGFLSYSVMSNQVTIPAQSSEINNPVPLIGNPGVPSWGFGAYMEQPWRGNISLTVRAGFNVWNAAVVGFDSMLTTASDGTRISEEFRLERTSLQLTLSPGAHYYFAKRKAYLVGILHFSFPLHISERFSRTILSSDNSGNSYVYDNGLGTKVTYEGSGPSGFPITLIPEIGIGTALDLPGGFRLFGELGAGQSITSISADRSWTIGYFFARSGIRVRI